MENDKKQAILGNTGPEMWGLIKKELETLIDGMLYGMTPEQQEEFKKSNELAKAFFAEFPPEEDWERLTGLTREELDNMPMGEAIALLKTAKAKDSVYIFPAVLQGLEPYPTSPILHEVMRVLNGAGIDRDVRHGKGVKHSDWTESDGRYTTTTKTRTATTTITVENIDILMKRYDKNLKKIFVFLLQKANKSHFNEANFALSELVNLGIYSSEKSARAGITKAMSKLMSIQISGELKKGKKTIKSGLGIMFYNLNINNSYCTVKINQELNIDAIAPFFSLFPVWAFQLSSKAFSIVEYIFYLARTNTSKIKQDGYFNINFGTINDYLQQHSPTETAKHSQYIINPILEAITEIEDTQSDTDYKFTPIYNPDYKNAVDFLKDGYLKIEMTAEALEYFTARADDMAKEYKKVAARKEKALLENEKKNR